MWIGRSLFPSLSPFLIAAGNSRPSGGSSSLSPLALPSPFHLTPVTLSRSVSLSVARSLPRADGRQVSKHCRQACVTKQITHTRAFKKNIKTQHERGACGQLRINSTLIGRLFHGTFLGSWPQQTLIEPRRALINSSQRCRDGLLRSGHRRGPSPPRQTGEKTFYGPLLWPRGHRHVGTGKGLP